jgi:hypothetical protein
MSFELILPFLRPIEPLLLDESISENMGGRNRRTTATKTSFSRRSGLEVSNRCRRTRCSRSELTACN